MLKHILGQTFFQMGILFAFTFGAPKFVPEYWDDAWNALYPDGVRDTNIPVLDIFPEGHEYW